MNDNAPSTVEPEVSNAHFNKPMKDVTDALEAKLFPTEEEPTDAEFEEVSDDEPLEEELPEDDDSEDDEEEGSDLDDIADGDELTLSDYLGIDEDRLVETDDGLMFNAIVDGETKQVPLKDLVADYQIRSHVNNKSIALENERKEFEDTRSNIAQQLQQRVEGIQALHKLAEDELVAEYNRINWDKLRVEDPGNWTALRQEYAERAQRIQQAQDLAAQESARLQEEQQGKFQERMKEHMQKEFQSMIAKNPEWADEEKLTSAMSGLKNFVSNTYGYKPEEFDNVTDHRLIELIKDAKAYREGTKRAEGKKVKRVPKFQKPGASRKNAANAAKARAVKAKKEAVRQSGGSTDSVANLLVDRM